MTVWLNRRQSARLPDFIHRQHAGLNEYLLDLRFFHRVAGTVDIGEDELEIIPAKLFADGITRQIFGEQSSSGNHCLAKRLIVHLTRGRAVHISLKAQRLRRQIERIRDDAQQKFLPLQILPSRYLSCMHNPATTCS